MAVLIMCHNESGDHYPLGVFEREPSRDEEKAIVLEYAPHEIASGQMYCYLESIELDDTALPIPEPSPESDALESL